MENIFSNNKTLLWILGITIYIIVVVIAILVLKKWPVLRQYIVGSKDKPVISHTLTSGVFSRFFGFFTKPISWGIFIVLLVIYIGGDYFFTSIFNKNDQSLSFAVSVPSELLGALVSTIGIAFVILILGRHIKVYDNQLPLGEQLFKNIDKLVLLVVIKGCLGVLMGALLIIPGIVFYYAVAPLYAFWWVNNYQCKQTLETSLRHTYGNRFSIFLYNLGLGLILGAPIAFLGGVLSKALAESGLLFIIVGAAGQALTLLLSAFFALTIYDKLIPLHSKEDDE